MYVHSTEDGGQIKDIVSMQIAGGGVWEKPELDQISWALKQPLPPGDHQTALFVDIGANVGWFTLSMAANGYNVEAYEGMQVNQELITATLCENKDLKTKINLHKYGLGAKAGKCFIFSGDWNRGNGITDCKSKTREEAQAKLTERHFVRSEMELKRLDSVLKADVKVMKMDVEGYEPWVLDGAQALFSEFRVWFLVLECNQPVLEKVTGLNCVDLSKQLHLLGFRLSITAFSGPFIPIDKEEGIAQLNKSVEAAAYKMVNIYCSNKNFVFT